MKKILLLILVTVAIYGKAQVNIGMSQVGPIGYADTVIAGSTGTYGVWVKNYGPSLFSDTLKIYTAVQDSSNTSIYNTVRIYDAGIVNINPGGDSTLISDTALYNLSPQGYRSGIVVIVVWPAAQSATTVDSLHFNVYIIDPNDVNEIDLRNLLKLYPNPTIDMVTIENSGSQEIESVSVFDINGKLVLLRKHEFMINMGELPSGIYNAVIELADKKRCTVKIIKQKK